MWTSLVWAATRDGVDVQELCRDGGTLESWPHLLQDAALRRVGPHLSDTIEPAPASHRGGVRARELAQPLASCSTWESGPFISTAQHSGAGPGGVRAGELGQFRCDLRNLQAALVLAPVSS